LDNRTAWEAVLEDLELRVDAAARSITGVADRGRAGSSAGTAVSTGSINNIWVAPARIGAIPAELAERARDLVHNQHKLISELETARNLTAKHLAAVRAVPPKRDARESVYLDVAG